MEFSELVHARHSISEYDPEAAISDEELKDLFEEVVLSPSSFNLQHWIFIVVRDPELKKKFTAAAMGQQQATDASVTILVCGKLDAYKDAAQIYSQAPAPVQEMMIPLIHGFYDGKEQFIRDEAIRSASLASMTLMFAAKNRGYDTGPMIGFDADAVSELLHVTPNYIPVMAVVVGRAKGEPRPRAYRRPLDEVVKIDALDGPGFGAA